MRTVRTIALLLLVGTAAAGPQSDVSDRDAVELFARLRLAIVRVEGLTPNRVGLPASGAFVGPDGIVITWSSRAKEGWKARIVLPGFERRDAKVIARDSATGVTVLQAEGRTPAYVTATAADLAAGDTSISAGHAYGAERADGGPATGLGIVSYAIPRTPAGRPARYLVSLAVNPGEYGGPVLSGDGRLAGVLLPVRDPGSDFFHALPISEIRRAFAKSPRIIRAFTAGNDGPDRADSLWPVHSALDEAARSVFPSVVSLTVRMEPKKGEQPRTRVSSGLLLDAEGYIVTTMMNLYRALETQASLSDGRSFPARRIATDERYDLALLKIEADNLPAPVTFATELPRLGTFVAAVGNPNGREARNGPLLSFGLIGGHGRPDRRFAALHTDAAINRANAGGALVDLDGRVVGIPTTLSGRAISAFGANSGIGFAVPAGEVARRLARLRKGESLSYAPGYLGVELSDEVADEAGVLVMHVADDQPAKRAGILVNDRILALDGIPIVEHADLRWVFSGFEEGQKITVTVLRGDELLDIEVTLGKR